MDMTFSGPAIARAVALGQPVAGMQAPMTDSDNESDAGGVEPEDAPRDQQGAEPNIAPLAPTLDGQWGSRAFATEWRARYSRHLQAELLSGVDLTGGQHDALRRGMRFMDAIERCFSGNLLPPLALTELPAFFKDPSWVVSEVLKQRVNPVFGPSYWTVGATELFTDNIFRTFPEIAIPEIASGVSWQHLFPDAPQPAAPMPVVPLAAAVLPDGGGGGGRGENGGEGDDVRSQADQTVVEDSESTPHPRDAQESFTIGCRPRGCGVDSLSSTTV